MTEGWSPRLFQCPLHALRPRRPCCFGIDVGQTSRIDETTYRMGGIDVRVASLNPVKLRAVRDAFAESFPNEAVDVCAIDPSAPLPDQPIEGDIARGAIARRGGRRGLGRRDRGAALPAPRLRSLGERSDLCDRRSSRTNVRGTRSRVRTARRRLRGGPFRDAASGRTPRTPIRERRRPLWRDSRPVRRPDRSPRDHRHRRAHGTRGSSERLTSDGAVAGIRLAIRVGRPDRGVAASGQTPVGSVTAILRSPAIAP